MTVQLCFYDSCIRKAISIFEYQSRSWLSDDHHLFARVIYFCIVYRHV